MERLLHDDVRKPSVRLDDKLEDEPPLNALLNGRLRVSDVEIEAAETTDELRGLLGKLEDGSQPL